MGESSGVGVMGYGDDEFMAHRAECRQCQNTTGWVSPNSTAYRPHTGDPRCWCCRSQNVRICLIDRKGWKPLDTVLYV